MLLTRFENISKNILPILLSIIFLFVLYILPVQAASPSPINISKYNQALGLNNTLQKASLTSLISYLLKYLIPLAGLILLGLLVYGGLTMLTGASSSEAQDKGKKIITSALIGFFLLVTSYWLAQILQVIFHIDIVGR